MQVPYIELSLAHSAIRAEIMAAVARVLDSGQFILGPEVERLEKEFAAYCRVKHAVAVGSGTAAITLALKGLGIGPGDEVITVANSFLATASAVVLAGAKPVFVDVGDDYNIDPQQIPAAITPFTRAILPVHLTGRPADMRSILSVAAEHGLVVIEDAAQAIGASFDDKRVGSFGTAGCFSFHPLKNLGGCGDGGMVTTDSDDLDQTLRLLRNHGLKSRDECIALGHNSRLDSLQAAVLRAKMKHLDDWNRKRRKHVRAYQEALGRVVYMPQDAPNQYAVYHTCMLATPARDGLQNYLQTRGVGTAVHYPIPIHHQAPFRHLSQSMAPLANTDRLAGEILSLPVYPELTTEQRGYVIDAILSFFNKV
jgi:dTDP-4-amino-4,6-dideoxygalactose transaminase